MTYQGAQIPHDKEKQENELQISNEKVLFTQKNGFFAGVFLED